MNLKKLKDNINRNDMVDDRNDDNDNDISSISKSKGEFVEVYANDNNKTIINIAKLVYGRFPTDFQPLPQLKPNDKVNANIPFYSLLHIFVTPQKIKIHLYPLLKTV